MSNALKKITAVLLVAAVLTSCSKSEEIPQGQTPDIAQTVSETAAAEPETQTTTTAAETTAATTTTVTTTAESTTATTTEASATTTAKPVTTTTAAPPVTTTTAARTTTTTAPPPVTTTTTAATTTTTAAPSLTPEEMEEQVFRLVNQIRAEYGLPAYQKSDLLSDAADKRAEEISSFYNHTRPNGTPFYTVLAEYGLNYSYTGENIAAGQRTAQVVVNDWMASTMGHREAILSSEYQYMGVGFVRVQSSDPQGYYYYWVQEFYTPL